MTPQRGTPPFDHFDARLELLCREWDLGLEPRNDYSPSKGGKTLVDKCLAGIRFLFFKGKLNDAIERFRPKANILYSGWVHKPRAERGVVPEATRNNPRPVTSDEREELLKCLAGVLQEEQENWMKEHGASPIRDHAISRNLNDTPVSFHLYPNGSHSDPAKRRREEAFIDLPMKKPKKPDLLYSKSVDTMPPPDRGRSMMTQVSGSANTSFVSNASSSVFSRNLSTLPNTQETVPDNEQPSCQTEEINESFMAPQDKKSSDYASSSFEARAADVAECDIIVNGGSFGFGQSDTDVHINEELSQDFDDFGISGSAEIPGEKELITKLQNVFPQMPASFGSASFAITYEVTRVFLHANVSLAEIELDFHNPSVFDDYDKLWRFLRDLPVLRGKQFPPKCSKEAWQCAFSGVESTFHGIVLAGSLKFSEESADRLFQFQLHPIRLDLCHRLGRRLGNDRFLEIDMPNLSKRRLPKLVTDLGARGEEILIGWLVDTAHQLLGRQWKSFFTRPQKKKDKRGDVALSFDINRVYFFAVDGNGFAHSKDPVSKLLGSTGTRPTMSVYNLLNLVRPTRKNKTQSYLKLFSRTSLALSRNWATVLLERRQILDRDDIICEKVITSGKIQSFKMTDGAGRISPSLALKVTQKLGLTFAPSGFQGRIGEAKGFWSVYYGDKTGIDWIEMYESQRKWNRSKKPNGESDDESHRTFEVVGFSAPLKSATLNEQLLPILVDRAKDPSIMKQSMINLLREGLAHETKDLRCAMGNPQLFRKWLREIKSNVSERLRFGRVPYRAGLPDSIEETLNMMLDGGFHPQKLYFMKDLARQVITNKCNELKKRLNITVDKSAYMYMIPDFRRVLEPDEVYVDFSSFVDESSGFSGPQLQGADVLVARSPAHFASDIQKVKVVAKAEFMGLKDVIVFPTKGIPSLAEKLSGGDYDGDRAWVCWEPTIVNNFTNADVPSFPKPKNLVELGYIHQDLRTYDQLIEGRETEATSIFLRNSFAFNMQPNLLGECTKFKDALCWTQRSISTPESVWLSALLSSLVDQAKQGFSFGESDWIRFKNEIVKIKPWRPPYSEDRLDRSSSHIIDCLRVVAADTVDKALEEFHKSFEDPPFWDEDLATQYKWAKEQARTSDEWKTLINHLDADLEVLKSLWKAHWVKHDSLDDESKSTFQLLLDECFEVYLGIRPRIDTPLAHSLLPDCLPDTEQSEWALLKASALFASHRSRSRFPWLMAGTQLVRLKGRFGGTPLVHTVVSSMYAMLKPDNLFVKRMLSGYEGSLPEEDAGVANIDDLEGLEDG